MKKYFYVYAGYYENYISSQPMELPRILRKRFRKIERAINYTESFGDTVIYCENVKDDLPRFLAETLQEQNYEFFKY